MKHIVKHITLIIVGFVAALFVTAQNTTRKRLKVQPHRIDTVVIACDTITGQGAENVVKFSGYEKTLRATRETVFVTNLTDKDISGLEFTVTYYDTSSRQLHRRRVESSHTIPAGETRRLDFPSWDKQNSFYSSTGKAPRVAAIPYTVTITEPKIFLVHSPAQSSPDASH